MHGFSTHSTFNLQTVRLALSGAILGIAITGILSLAYPIPYHDAIGALLGGASVFAAKAKHLF